MTRSTIVNVPVHNIVDTFTWTKGQHSLSFGVNYRLVFNNRDSNASSFNSRQYQRILDRGRRELLPIPGTVSIPLLSDIQP